MLSAVSWSTMFSDVVGEHHQVGRVRRDRLGVRLVRRTGRSSARPPGSSSSSSTATTCLPASIGEEHLGQARDERHDLLGLLVERDRAHGHREAGAGVGGAGSVRGGAASAAANVSATNAAARALMVRLIDPPVGRGWGASPTGARLPVAAIREALFLESAGSRPNRRRPGSSHLRSRGHHSCGTAPGSHRLRCGTVESTVAAATRSQQLGALTGEIAEQTRQSHRCCVAG